MLETFTMYTPRGTIHSDLECYTQACGLHKPYRRHL